MKNTSLAALLLSFATTLASCSGTPSDPSGGGGASGGPGGASGAVAGTGGGMRGGTGGSTGGGVSRGGTGGGTAGGEGGGAGSAIAGRGGSSAGGGSTGGGGSGGVAGGSGGSGRVDAGSDAASSDGAAAGAAGGQAGSGGTSATGGASGSGGTTAVLGPCDIYAAGNTPCVAAHSTVRALAGAYSGNLYQVKKANGTTLDIGVLARGGFANAAAQDTFCAGTTCTISIIYDQSGKGNHLTKAPAGGAGKTPDTEAVANALKLNVGGHMVYGVHVTPGIGYRNNATAGVAIKDQPESMYMITSGNYSNNQCCFDYGNAETNNLDNGNGTMEAIYFGSCTFWGKGAGAGPWVMADLENGLFAGKDFGPTATNTPLTSAYVTAMLIGRSGSFAIKGGNAQTGALTVMYDGARPANGYNPMKKEGAILLGIGGDNSNLDQGNFFEGCMTSGASVKATDDAVQANIVAAGYGR